MRSFDKIFESLTQKILVTFIFLMLLLTLLNIVLRWFSINYHWIDPLVRHLVFFSSFLGGILATGKKNHIRIDIFSTLYGKKYPQLFSYFDRLISIVSSFSCFAMAYAGYEFFKVELEYGQEVFWNIHSSTLVFVIPLGFTLIAIRFLTSIKGQDGAS